MSLWSDLPPLSPKGNQPLYSQVAETLSAFIKLRQFPPGTLMPTENELMAVFGVSRTTVRQAIQQLESNGLAEKIQGKGTFVAEPKKQSQIRFFSSVERWLALQGLQVNNQLLTNLNGTPPDWAVDMGFPSEGPVRIIRRLKLLDGRPLALEQRILPPDIADLLNEDEINKNALFRALDDHPQAYTCRVLYSIRATIALDETAEILQIEPGSPLMVRTGIYRNASGRFIMAAQVVFVADPLDFRMEFVREDDYWAITDSPDRLR